MSDTLMAWLSAHRLVRVALAIVVLGSITAVTFAAGYQNSAAVLGDGSAYLQKEHSVVHVNAATGDVDAQSARALATGAQKLEVVQVRPGVVYVVNNETGDVYALPTDTMKPEQIDKRPESSGRLQLESGGNNSYLVDAERGTASKLDGTSGPGSDVPIPARIDQLVVDGNGIGWAFAPDSGELFQLNGGQVVGRQRVAGLGERVALSLVGNRPLLYRPANGQASIYDSGGQMRRFDLAAEGGIVAEPSNADTIAVFVPRTGEFVVADVGGGDIRRVVLPDRRGEQHRFGRPVLFHGRAYLPDYTFHHVVVIDLATPRVVAAEPVPGRSRPFDVFVRDNLLWVSDPYDKAVFTFDKSGNKNEGGTGRPHSRPSTSPSPSRSAQPSAGPASPTPPATMRVPNVVGDDRTRACAKLRPLRCHQVAVPEGDGQTGIVLSTDPPAGSRVRLDSRVTVFYRGPAEVPDVAGARLTATEACEAIRRAKLTCTQRREGTARTASEAFVVTAQQPPAGTRVDTGTEVVVTYPVNVLVPNVVGAAVDQACATLVSATHGFTCARRDLGSAAGTGYQPGVVIAQRPGANAGAPRGSQVQVDYYGNANTTVPAVVGASPDAACAALAAAHLGCTRNDYVATRQLGVVLAQSHAGGSVVPAGTAVTISYETTGPVAMVRYKAPAPRRANFIAVAGTPGPAGWSSQPQTPVGIYPAGTADLPGLWPIYRSRCVSGCGEIGGYYYSANAAVQTGYVMEGEAFRCFGTDTTAGTKELHALLLNAGAWVWAVPGSGEWDVFMRDGVQRSFVVCRVW